MHAVKPPERRHRVEEHVLQIDREIEDHHRQHHGDPPPHRDHVEDAKPLRLRNQRQADGGGRKQDADKERIDDHDAEIVGPAPRPPDGLLPTRYDPFPSRHDDEYASEGSQPDCRFVGKETSTHRVLVSTY